MGAVNVACNLTTCRNATRARLFQKGHDRIRLDLFKDGKLIRKANSVDFHEFKVDFETSLGERKLSYNCVWRNESQELCRREVLIDLFSLPLPVQNVNMPVKTSESVTLNSKMINVEWSAFSGNDKGGANHSVTVYKYRSVTRNCSLNSKDTVDKSETKACARKDDFIVCNGFFRRLVYFPGIFAAVVTSENPFGVCRNVPFCKELSFFDIYGNLAEVKASFAISRANLKLVVSWLIPKGLKTAANKVVFSIKYCKRECWHKNITKSLLSAEGQFVSIKISKNVDYNSLYDLQIRYIIDGRRKESASPWTGKVFVKTPNKIPTSSPHVIKCEGRKERLSLQWENDHVEFYSLKVEENGKMDKFLRVMPSRCTHHYCSHAVARHSQRKAFRVTVISCSKFGCDNSSTSHCYFRAKPVLQASRGAKTQPKYSGKIVTIVILFAFLVLALFGVFVIFKVYRRVKLQKSLGKVRIIRPRSFSDSEYAPTSSDQSEAFYTGYDTVG